MNAPGPLEGIRVLELSSPHGAFTGKLLADLGADVVVVEPPGGDVSRTYPPFADDEPGPERSLWWWHYNTSKRGIVLDLGHTDDAHAFRRLAADADVVLVAGPPGALGALGLDYEDLREGHDGLIWVEITPFGRTGGPEADDSFTDLTLLARGGLAWMCGYDDHTIPPVRPGGNQAFHTAGLWAVMGTLTAVLNREITGRGQAVDVSMLVAVTATTETASYAWMVAEQTVQRQTGRHASAQPTQPTMVVAADGVDAHTGVPPRRAREFQILLEWLDDLGLRREFPETVLLEMGVDGDDIDLARVGDDPVVAEIYGAGREALKFIARRLPGQEFFLQSQSRGLSCGVVYAPEEVLADPQFIDRGFPVDLEHELLGRSVTYPGAPFIASASPWRLSRRAPLLGEHQDEVLAAISTDD